VWRVTVRLRVPTYLQASTDVGGPARAEWLAALPDRVEELTARWGLELGEPFEPGGNCSWVAPGIDDLPGNHPFRPLSVMADDWVVRAQARLAADPGRLDTGLARDGLDLFRELSRTGPTEVLLFTDLHAGNVLSGERRPWLLIDPKPYVGDPHYDVLQHLLNCNASLQPTLSGC